MVHIQTCVGKFLRLLIAIVLVCVILYFVISPYVDLPLTTLRARQAILCILTAVLLCLTAVRPPMPFIARAAPQLQLLQEIQPATPLDLSCALLC